MVNPILLSQKKPIRKISVLENHHFYEILIETKVKLNINYNIGVCMVYSTIRKIFILKKKVPNITSSFFAINNRW